MEEERGKGQNAENQCLYFDYLSNIFSETIEGVSVNEITTDWFWFIFMLVACDIKRQ